MKIEERKITVAELFDGYSENDDDNSVIGFGGKLDIRPPYQREFVYKDEQQAAVIDTVRKGFPLNVMYWAVRDSESTGNEKTFEVMDGQQRTISICRYLKGQFSVNYQFFHNLTEEEKEAIRQYELTVYECSGSDREKLDWFKTINIAGEKLSPQELRNAVYHGSWLSDAKKWLSRPGTTGAAISADYTSSSVIRQELLETAIEWIIVAQGLKAVEDYMAAHQHDTDADEIWNHFRSVIAWVSSTFPKKRGEMKKVNWGNLHTQHGDTLLDTEKLEDEVSKLMQDEDVTKKSGVYPYVLDGNESHLNIRSFTKKQITEAYERQGGICPQCGDSKVYDASEMEADHIIPWSKGGRTEPDNCQMLCKDHNRRKSNK